MQQVLNVALVGYGFVGQVFHAPLISHTPGLRLHSVASSNARKVLADHPSVKVETDPAAVFANPQIDLVVIAAPNAVHASLATAALTHGKHVVVDKPFTVTLAEAYPVVEAAAKAGRVLSVFQNRRWDADFLAVRQLLETGLLGEVAEFHSHFDRHRPQVVDRWREQDQPGAGLWYDLGPHLVDQALQLFGMPEAITADLARQRERAQAVDYFHVLLRYPRHRVILHAGSLVAANGLRFAVHGSSGSYLKYGLDTQEAALKQGAIPGQADWGHDPSPGMLHTALSTSTPTPFIGPRGDYRHYYAAMRDAILQRSPPPVSTQQALQVMALLEAGIHSSAQRREIPCTAPPDCIAP